MPMFPPPSPKPRRDDDRVLPLINVVFLLLIFFMLAGQFAAIDPFRIDPPASASDGLVEARRLVVLIGADGRLALDGREMEAGALEAAVAARLQRAPQSPVQVKADGRAEADAVVALLETLRAAGVTELQLLTVAGK